MKSIVVAIFALVLVASPAWAAWSVKGTNEPDTKRDNSDGWMYKTPDVNPSQLVRKVYFNGFIGEYSPVTASPVGESTNPNVGAQKTAFMPYSYYFQTVFGVWKDCNGDGYIGWGDQGLIEYRSDLLLLSTNVCAPQSTPANPPLGKPPMDWFPSHNDGQWVRELLPFSWVSYDAAVNGGDANPYNVNDNASRVWADVGLPDSLGAASATCGYTPYGMTRTTGGTLRWIDCLAAWRITDNSNTIIAAAGGDGLGAGRLSFSDKPRDQEQSASILNQKNPWGSESDGSMASMWDCSADQTALPPINNANSVNVSSPQVPQPQSGGSLAGTANETGSGFDECNRTSRNDGHSHWGQSAGSLPYSMESGRSVGAGQPKTQTDILAPQETIRPNGAFSQLGRATPSDLGARVSSDDGFWRAPGRTGIQLVRADVAKPLQSTNLTYYAYVSPTAIAKYGLSLPKGSATESYGTSACGTVGLGRPVVNGWDCDPSHWWTDPSGVDIRPRSGTLAEGGDGQLLNVQAGSPYNMRDIDCYDFQFSPVRETGVLTSMSANPCVGP